MTTKKQDLVGPDTKVCKVCGTTIHREGMANLQWIRKAYCSKACQASEFARKTWARRAACNG